MSSVIEMAVKLLHIAEHDGEGCRCCAYGRHECACGADWLEPATTADIIRDLLAIVERLPKDKNGDPVLIGEEYTGDYLDTPYYYEAEVAGADDDYYSPSSMEWSEMTPRAAAEAARGGEGE